MLNRAQEIWKKFSRGIPSCHSAAQALQSLEKHWGVDRDLWRCRKLGMGMESKGCFTGTHQNTHNQALKPQQDLTQFGKFGKLAEIESIKPGKFMNFCCCCESSMEQEFWRKIYTIHRTHWDVIEYTKKQENMT